MVVARVEKGDVVVGVVADSGWDVEEGDLDGVVLSWATEGVISLSNALGDAVEVVAVTLESSSNAGDISQSTQVLRWLGDDGWGWPGDDE